MWSERLSYTLIHVSRQLLQGVCGKEHALDWCLPSMTSEDIICQENKDADLVLYLCGGETMTTKRGMLAESLHPRRRNVITSMVGV